MAGCWCLAGLLALLLIAQPAVAQQGPSIQLEPLQTFTESEQVPFGTIVTAAVASNGVVYIADNTHLGVHVYSADGTYQQTFGRQGSGPGEFQMIRKILIDPARVHVFDAMQRMVHVFDRQSYAHLRSMALGDAQGQPQQRRSGGMGSRFPVDLFLLDGGNEYLVVLQDMMQPSTLFAEVIDSAGRPKEGRSVQLKGGDGSEQRSGGMRIVANVPFMHRTLLAVTESGAFLRNWNAALEFEWLDEKGEPAESFSHLHRAVPLERSALDTYFENAQARVVGGGGGSARPAMAGMLAQMELPDHWPVVQRIVIDDNDRIWAETIVSDLETRKWMLFSRSGEVLGTANWDIGTEVVKADGDIVYLRETDDDGITQVTRYRMTM